METGCRESLYYHPGLGREFLRQLLGTMEVAQSRDTRRITDWLATGKYLISLFTAHGTVEPAKVITDKFTGQSRGFGFVEMSSGGEAQRAIEALNGTQLEGRTLVVNEAKPMQRRDGGGGGRDNRSGGRNRW